MGRCTKRSKISPFLNNLHLYKCHTCKQLAKCSPAIQRRVIFSAICGLNLHPMSGLESSKPIEYYRRIRVKRCDLCKVIWLVDLKLICTAHKYSLMVRNWRKFWYFPRNSRPLLVSKSLAFLFSPDSRSFPAERGKTGNYCPRRCFSSGKVNTHICSAQEMLWRYFSLLLCPSLWEAVDEKYH